jgi:flagellar hook-length control protein FliK
MLAAGGRILPPGGSGLPLSGPPTVPGANTLATGQATDLNSISTAQSGSRSDASLPAPLQSLAPLLATSAAATTAPAPWLRALLAGDRGAGTGDSQSLSAGDTVAVGDGLLATNSSRSALPTTSVVLPTSPAQQPAFEQALGDRLVWLVQEGRQDARMKLHPAELGSIDIRLSLDGDATRISLASPHAAVRDALEQAVPRLRELLGNAGLDLGQVDVGTGDARSHGDFGRPTSAASNGNDFSAVANEGSTVVEVLALRMPQGLVDTFA